jgi:sugar-phosphatase
MLTLKCQAILFDLDGTLIDSALRLRRLWQNWGQQNGFALESILEIMHGRRASETIKLIAPHLPIEKEVNALETEEISDMEGVEVYIGASELLSKLSSKQWAIVTSGSRKVSEARLKYVRLSIPNILITGDDVRIGKPAPDGYLLAAYYLNLKPTDCVVIEDAPAGVQAGKSAGMRVIGVATTHSWEELYQADIITQRLTELSLNITGREIKIQFKS